MLIGIESAMNQAIMKPDKPDLFELCERDPVWSWPCSDCRHRDREETECEECRYYAV